jgi:hypothetical protein
MHLCVYADLCIYEFVSVSTFNHMQILIKHDKMLRLCRTLKGKIYASKSKSDGARNCAVGKTLITLSL